MHFAEFLTDCEVSFGVIDSHFCSNDAILDWLHLGHLKINCTQYVLLWSFFSYRLLYLVDIIPMYIRLVFSNSFFERNCQDN